MWVHEKLFFFSAKPCLAVVTDSACPFLVLFRGPLQTVETVDCYSSLMHNQVCCTVSKQDVLSLAEEQREIFLCLSSFSFLSGLNSLKSEAKRTYYQTRVESAPAEQLDCTLTALNYEWLVASHLCYGCFCLDCQTFTWVIYHLCTYSIRMKGHLNADAGWCCLQYVSTYKHVPKMEAY